MARAESGLGSAIEGGKVHVGLLAVVLILIVVFVAFSFTLYTLEKVFGISIPEITITLTWALIGLVGVWVLGHTIQTTTSQLIGPRAASTARKVVTLTLVIAIVIATLSSLHIDVTGYLVSLGVTAVVIGFAAQATIGNLIAGMLVLVSKPFRKGDYIRINITGEPIEGTIDEISFLRSRIFTNDGVSISVPNTVMLATPISNFTVFEKRPIILNISLERNFSVDSFRSKVESAMLRNGVAMVDTRVYVKGFDQDSASVELWVQVATQNFLKERSLIVQSIEEICQREKIQLKKIEIQS
jgi:small-conductance mechanosensitive channel